MSETEVKENKNNPVPEADNGQLFSVKEAYKTLRTNLLLSIVKKGCKKIIISSSIPGEGKTTTATNVALSMSQIDKKVLLIDADLRKPKIHKAMNLPNTPGLTNVLSGLSNKEKAINIKSANLSVLCSGISVPNPSEILSSQLMSEFLTELEASYDYIIMDTPPLNVVSDALTLIKQSDGVLLVVRPYHSTHIELQKTIKSLEFIDAKILGFVLNDVNEEKENSYKYKYKGKYNNYYYK
jgi:capsular exopolysaccharide synthesis family protein